MMNLKQLARHLSLSPATVSRVLGGKGAANRIGQKTQAKVLKAAREMGVMVDHQARGLRLRATHTLGFIVPDISNPFFAAFCRQVEAAARARGYSVLVADSEEQVEVEQELIRLMRGRKVDGLILAPVIGRGAHLARLVRDFQRVVLFDRVAATLKVPAMVLDNAGAARAGVRLLAKAGHRDIACVQGKPDSVSNQERLAGFRAEMKARGLTLRHSWIVGSDYTVEGGRAGVQTLLAQTPRRRPTAILALGNLLALGALEAFRAANLNVPDQMSLVSFDEQQWAASLHPPLTTIAQPVSRMAARAVELLFEDRGQRAPRRIVMPFEIIERQSLRRLGT